VAEETSQTKPPEQPQLEATRSEEFENLWANNVLFESTLWDLRLIFGQVDLAAKQIVQHTAVNIPWPQVKIAAYFMLVNVVIQQSLNGNVFIPGYIVPPRPDPADPANAAYDKQMIKYLGWIHDQFFGSNPYIPEDITASPSEPPRTQA
jgi:hypothetical protein